MSSPDYKYHADKPVQVKKQLDDNRLRKPKRKLAYCKRNPDKEHKYEFRGVDSFHWTGWFNARCYFCNKKLSVMLPSENPKTFFYKKEFSAKEKEVLQKIDNLPELVTKWL